MLMSSGFTDDLFPADETIRYYNRTKTQYPDADLALFFGDFGHPRAQNKADVTGALSDRSDAWFDCFVKGEGSSPPAGRRGVHRDVPERRRPRAVPTRPTAGRRWHPARSASATTRRRRSPPTRTPAATSTR